MTMIPGNDGAMNNVDLTHATTLECEECKCKAFKQTLMLKKLSALVSPSGQEAIIPVAAFACETCGNINQEFRDAFVKIRQEGDSAISLQDKALLSRVNEQLITILAQIYHEDPGMLVHRFEEFANGQHNFTDQAEADYFIKKGKKAIELNDHEELKRCVSNLILLLPPEEQDGSVSILSGITK